MVAPPADDGADPEEEEDPAPPVTALPTVVDTGRRLLEGVWGMGEQGLLSRLAERTHCHEALAVTHA